MILVVIPAYNEAKNIARVLTRLFECGHKSVVVVDDGSTDATATVARALGAVVLRHAVNRGQGAALQTGHEYALCAGATTVVHFDADDQLNPVDITGAVDLLKRHNLDVVLGSRFLDSRSNVPCLKRYFFAPLARLINFIFTGLYLSDAHNGFRVLSRRALDFIVITQDRMAHGSEIPALIKVHGLRYAEYPVQVIYHRFGQGLAGGAQIVADLVIGKFNSK